MTVQRVLITAGAGGIGRAIVQAFMAQGAKVFVCDIDADGLTRLEADFPGVKSTLCDISNLADIEKMVALAAQTLGGLDVLINNAGIAGPTAPVDQLDPTDWAKVVQINLNGTFNVTHFAIPHLKKSAAGSIINMSSVSGRFGYPNRSAYSTTKWGLIGFTKTLSIELGADNIRVNAILPGAVDGPRFQNVLKGRAQLSGRSIEEETVAALGTQSIKHLVNPNHIADLAFFLASPSGESISGQMLPIDCDMQHTS
ncbi:SDR family oxidoreductase [Pseudomonas sp. Y39-6]|uniref:SDR family oxidoreductase n=1 Tax=Pseudomonas sp. Y39-6 TaxID=2749807 RepID=UPI0019109460|nr:SDR family oxidoreductase [Pseudomonas sp. Y39-6]QPO21738.1 SDR family oxidoreductase [Pseudomonas sp. Y39-6]URS58995.1 SDR family oxidoreductase [Pseudomonas sp. Y39-6]